MSQSRDSPNPNDEKKEGADGAEPPEELFSGSVVDLCAAWHGHL